MITFLISIRVFDSRVLFSDIYEHCKTLQTVLEINKIFFRGLSFPYEVRSSL